MRLRLLILFVFLFYDLTVVNLELLFVRLVRLCGPGLLPLGGHVKYLKHCVIVEMFEVERLEYYLADDEIHELFLQLYFIEETGELLLRYSALAVSLPIQRSQDMLVVICDELGDLDKHLFLFLLAHDLIRLNKFSKIDQHFAFGQFFVFIDLRFRPLVAFLIIVAIKQFE